MKLAYVSTADLNDVRKFSGTPFHMSKAFQSQNIEIEPIHKLKTKVSFHFKLKRAYNHFIGIQEESSRFNLLSAKNYALQVESKLKNSTATAVISHVINPVSYLECKQPIILWTDALYAALLGYIDNFSKHSANTILQANQLTAEGLSRSSLAIFSSDWAARSAMELYGISKEKIKVVPFGANIDCEHTLFDIHAFLKLRSRKKIKLLFLGKEWHRKGGDIVLAVTNALHNAGEHVELHIVGCNPPTDYQIPSFVKCHGYLSKQNPMHLETINSLLRESHFLFVPSRAEPFGIVFCEANAFGLPCLTSPVGGISTIIQDNINGMKFSLNSPIENYCTYILQLMNDYSRYEELCLSAFNEFKQRLNWKVSATKVITLINKL